jgi:hypothetical protein
MRLDRRLYRIQKCSKFCEIIFLVLALHPFCANRRNFHTKNLYASQAREYFHYIAHYGIQNSIKNSEFVGDL